VSVFDRAEADGLYNRWTLELQEVEAERERLDVRERGLRQLVAGLDALFPDLAATPTTAVATPPATAVASAVAPSTPETGARPPGMTSVQIAARVVEECAGTGAMTVPQVAEEMERRGWLPDAAEPLAAVRTALVRAKAQGLVHSRPVDGRSVSYRPGPEPADPQLEVG